MAWVYAVEVALVMASHGLRSAGCDLLAALCMVAAILMILASMLGEMFR